MSTATADVAAMDSVAAMAAAVTGTLGGPVTLVNEATGTVTVLTPEAAAPAPELEYTAELPAVLKLAVRGVSPEQVRAALTRALAQAMGELGEISLQFGSETPIVDNALQIDFSAIALAEVRAPERSWHFNLGDSTNGPIGLCARVRARTEEQAVALLKEALPTEVIVPVLPQSGVEYISFHLNPELITAGDIDEINDLD